MAHSFSGAPPVRGGGTAQKACARLHRLRLLVLAAPLLWACDGGTDPVLVGSVVIDAVAPHLTVGNSVQLIATVLSTTGSVLPGHPVTWTSSAPAVAAVTTGGRVTALAGGIASIRATSEGKSASVAFAIEEGPCTAATAGSIALGETRTGDLGPADCMLFGSRAEGWTFQLASTGGVRIVMSSTAFGPDPVLTNSQLDPVLWAQPHPDGSQLVGELPAGQYVVWARSYDYDPSGAYQLSASEAHLCTSASATETIGIGETRSGTLGDGDCVFLHGGGADGFGLAVTGTTGLRIDLASSAFDALLVVTDPAMNVLWWDDDSGGNLNSRIERRVPAGEYIVWATSFGGGGAGAYQLSVAEVEIPLCPIVGDVALGQTVSGALAETDCRGDRGYADPWRLSVASQTTVRIDLTSTQFDTFLVVEDQHGGQIAWDDDGGDGYNSRLEHTFPAGEYRIVATSFTNGATGAYQLSVQAVAGTASLRAPAAAPALPWLKAGGKD
ncbi:MAG TPA: Ig-like domain-containing protein [Longimicrobiales bacterium]|nr:Ig-like domain-containing protein [Longimicrobiales bacterium]